MWLFLKGDLWGAFGAPQSPKCGTGIPYKPEKELLPNVALRFLATILTQISFLLPKFLIPWFVVTHIENKFSFFTPKCCSYFSWVGINLVSAPKTSEMETPISPKITIHFFSPRRVYWSKEHVYAFWVILCKNPQHQKNMVIRSKMYNPLSISSQALATGVRAKCQQFVLKMFTVLWSVPAVRTAVRMCKFLLQTG